MISKSIKILASVLLVAMSALFMSSCGDDGDGDKKDCGALSNQLSSATNDLLEALDGGDCTDVENAYNDLLDAYRDGDDCDAFKNAVEDAGYDNYNEFLDDLEDERDLYLADC